MSGKPQHDLLPDIYGRTYHLKQFICQHLKILKIVMTRLEQCNLKAQEKSFFQPRIKLLGHVVSEDGIETDPEKIEKINNWPTSSNEDDLRFVLLWLGITGGS